MRTRRFLSDGAERACTWLDNHTPAWPFLMGRLRCPNGWLARLSDRILPWDQQ